MFIQKEFENILDINLETKSNYSDKETLNTCYPTNENVIECCICLEPLKNDHSMDCCSQKIHKKCLKSWCEKDYNLKILSKCPMCRTEFDNKDLFQISFYGKLKNIFFDCNLRRKD